MQRSDEPTLALGRECQRIAPEVPLKSDDGETGHACPYHAERRLSSGETGVQKAQAGYHDHHHSRCYDDVGLVSGGIPLIEVLDRCRGRPQVSQAIASITSPMTVDDSLEDKVKGR